MQFLGIYVSATIFIVRSCACSQDRLAADRLGQHCRQRRALLDVRDPVHGAASEGPLESLWLLTDIRAPHVVELDALFHGFAVRHDLVQPGHDDDRLVLGVIIGVLPGWADPNGVAILLPLTFGMSPTRRSHVVLHHWGSLFAGAITSILFNIPVRRPSVAKTLTATRSRSRAAERALTASVLGLLRRRLERGLSHVPGALGRSSPAFGPPEFLRCSC